MTGLAAARSRGRIGGRPRAVTGSRLAHARGARRGGDSRARHRDLARRGPLHGVQLTAASRLIALHKIVFSHLPSSF